MKLLHTADWHLGRSLEGRSRQIEQEKVMEEIIQIAEDEHVDAVLMAGDVFDTVNPSAISEQLFYETAQRLSKGGQRPLAVISGNHDHPERVQAASPIASDHGIYLIGRPVDALIPINIPKLDQQLRLMAVPYPSESRLNECLAEINEDGIIQQAYDERLSSLFQHLSSSFRPDTVNIAMSHIFVAGGKESESERPIQIGGAYTVSLRSLPSSAQYVALGHLHRPQNLSHKDTLARYSGSPLAYSFSEANQSKSVTIVNVEPGKTPRIEERLLSSGRPLVKWRAADGIDQVYQWLEENRDPSAWIDLEIKLSEALSMHDIQALRKAREGFVNIRPIYEEKIEKSEERRSVHTPIDQLFKRFYHLQTGGAEPSAELTELFLTLINETVQGEE